MEHLVEITVFLASISAILLVSGLIILKTNFPLNSKSAESEGWREDIIYENEHCISVQIVPLMGQHTAVCFTY